MSDFRDDLVRLINRHSKENESNTPDFILADYLVECLAAYNSAARRRSAWHQVGVIEGAVTTGDLNEVKP